jgi:hypothetical protein
MLFFGVLQMNILPQLNPQVMFPKLPSRKKACRNSYLVWVLNHLPLTTNHGHQGNLEKQTLGFWIRKQQICIEQRIHSTSVILQLFL